MINNGTVSATTSGQSLTIDPVNAGNSFINNGTVSANGGVLVLTGANSGGFDNTNGKIIATSTDVQLVTFAGITGGILQSTGAGVIRVPVGQQVSLADNTLNGNLSIENNSQVNWSGTLTDNGSINLNANANTTTIQNSGTATLTGTGVVNLNQSVTGFTAIGGSGTLVTSVPIRGAGNVGNNTIFVRNSSTITANNATLSLTLDPVNASGGFTNTGTLIANGGVLNLTGANGGDFDNTAGRIIAGSTDVQLVTFVGITGGTFSSSGAGVFRVTNGTTAGIANITLNGNVTLDNNTQLNWSGTVANNGSINFNPAANNSAFSLSGGGNGTLSGGGIVNMVQTAAGQPIITGSGTIISNNTIQGAGNIGANQVAFTNNATIIANDPAHSLTLDPVNAGNSFINNGTYTANGGVLVLTGANSGDF
jgi:hypothetical protein